MMGLGISVLRNIFLAHLFFCMLIVLFNYLKKLCFK